jgi:tetratricopeptide (TPR) repeat protein
LTGAYAAYNAGDMSRATTLYNQVLGQDPHNRDALDGMGAIALRLGREAEAEAWFRRSLAADPNDPVAQAGLAQLRGRGQPGEESRMKSLIAAQPQAAPGHFALGNALAAQDRWPEAQQAYFDAHTLDPGNPDYLFNLAVSLDQLHHYSLARRFYAEALAAATTRAASFERAPVEARLQALDEAR